MPDLTEVPSGEEEQHQAAAGVHGEAGSEGNFPFDLNFLEPVEHGHMETGKSAGYLHGSINNILSMPILVGNCMTVLYVHITLFSPQKLSYCCFEFIKELLNCDNMYLVCNSNHLSCTHKTSFTQNNTHLSK